MADKAPRPLEGLTSRMTYGQMRRYADSLDITIGRTRRETALKLIDPLEYRTAEAMYEGDAYQIACELDVTLQVIQDYQQLLDSNATVSIRFPEPTIA